MIHLNSVSFGYSRQKQLFENLNLRLEPGHIYGLLGKNGAGKSSLLRLMAGLLFPQNGTLQVAGFEPCHRKPSFLQGIFFIPEEIFLPPVSVQKYMDTMAPFYPNFRVEQFRNSLKEFEVPFDSKLMSLSYGQKKKVLISFGLATNTRALIMDEPTNGLDIPSKSQFRKLVVSALESYRTILISTHQVRDLDNLIDSVIIMDESQILLHQPLEKISERLRFATLVETGENEEVLFAEPNLKGFSVVMENPLMQESRVDLEKLFNAVMRNPERIRQLFRSEP